MIVHLSVLQVIIPLMAAPLCLLLRKRERVWAVCNAGNLSDLCRQRDAAVTSHAVWHYQLCHGRLGSTVGH
jgi:hypothetical protein